MASERTGPQTALPRERQRARSGASQAMSACAKSGPKR